MRCVARRGIDGGDANGDMELSAPCLYLYIHYMYIKKGDYDPNVDDMPGLDGTSARREPQKTQKAPPAQKA